LLNNDELEKASADLEGWLERDQRICGSRSGGRKNKAIGDVSVDTHPGPGEMKWPTLFVTLFSRFAEHCSLLALTAHSFPAVALLLLPSALSQTSPTPSPTPTPVSIAITFAHAAAKPSSMGRGDFVSRFAV
jgi:hypothetical protein